MEFGNMEELIFGESSELFFGENAGEEISDEELNEFGIIETGEEPEVAGYAIALENEQNFNAIMSAMMVKEYACLESTGIEMVYTEGTIGDFFDAVKSTVKRWWGKFMETIQKAQETIIRYTRENGAFIKKYKNKNMEAPVPATMEAHGYEYKNLKGSGKSLISKAIKVKSLSDNCKLLNKTDVDALNGHKEGFEKICNEYDDDMKETFNSHAGTKDLSIADAVKAYYRGPKKRITVGDYKTLLKEMESASEIRKWLKEDYDTAKKSMKEVLKSIAAIQKSCDRKDEAGKAALAASKPLITLVKKTLNTAAKVQSVSNQVYFEKCKFDRAKVMWIVNHQPKPKDESATNVDEGLGIVLV